VTGTAVLEHADAVRDDGVVRSDPRPLYECLI
jgi:hypothetical protein